MVVYINEKVQIFSFTQQSCRRRIEKYRWETKIIQIINLNIKEN